MKRGILSFLCVLIGMGHWSFAQIQVINFTPESYHAAGQNWSIAEWNNHIYCANHDGLLQYNGNDWTTLISKEQPDVRAVEIWNNRIYTAGANSLGYWTMSPYSPPEYVSLFTQVQHLGVKDDIVFWSIAHTDDAIYFQSFTHIIGCRNDRTSRGLARKSTTAYRQGQQCDV